MKFCGYRHAQNYKSGKPDIQMYSPHSSTNLEEITVYFHSLICFCASSSSPLTSRHLDLSQVPQPTVPLWRRWAATCKRPSTSPPLATSSWSAGPRTTARTRRASKFAMLVSTKVCIPTLFLLLLHIIIMHGNKDRGRQTEGLRDILSRSRTWRSCSTSKLCQKTDHNLLTVMKKTKNSSTSLLSV